ncbi:MAG: zinc ribbon domain-containing protein [Gemmatimonadetes bacterium]|nr:zinc ribbon domain-containing protein [Gemmatimonadota bacterium]
MKCPSCGTEATGRYCPNCGASLMAQRCPHCNAEVRAGSRYCQSCGRSMSSHGRSRAIPWIVAGATVAALSAVLLVRLTSQKAAGAGPSPLRGAASQPASDISNLSPRERADRLFNRVMAASEQGDTTDMRFFIPMALQSYAMLGPLDADARYHVGAIEFVNNNYKGALAQADTISRAVPNHLLANALRAQVAAARGDTGARNRAYRALLDAYDSEMAKQRPEYADHSTLLGRTRAEAQQALASEK